MKDPSNIQEFARSAHRPPTQAELSSFMFWDGLAGMVNHLWIGPLLGLTVGGIGAILGKLQFLAEQFRRPSPTLATLGLTATRK